MPKKMDPIKKMKTVGAWSLVWRSSNKKDCPSCGVVTDLKSKKQKDAVIEARKIYMEQIKKWKEGRKKDGFSSPSYFVLRYHRLISF